MDLMQLTATLGLDASGFEAGVNKSRGIFGGLSGTISAGTVALGSLMADVVRKGADMVVDLGKTALGYNMQMEDYTANFRVMLGSTEAAAAKVEALKEFAAKTPFEMTDLAGATQTLLAFGIEAERTDGIMQMLGDVSLGNSQKFASLATVFGQVSSSGKLLGQDLMQFINQGFNPLQVIAEKTGASMGDLKNVMSGQKTSKDFQRMVRDAQKEVRKLGDGASESAKLLAQIGEDGMISAEMVEEAFRIAISEGGQFYNGMEEASKTLSGLMSTLSDNWTALVGDVFKPVSDFLQTSLIPRAIEAVDTLQKAFDEGGFSGMAEAAGNMVGNFAMGIVSAAPLKMIAAADAIVSALNAQFGINIPTVKEILVNPPTWEELSAQMTSWWSGIQASMSSLLTWALGEFEPPDIAGVASSVSTWWLETARPAIMGALTWAMGAFEPPGIVEISAAVSAWWTGTAWPMISGVLGWTLGTFAQPGAEDIALLIGTFWAEQVRPLLDSALEWALGTFSLPSLAALIENISTWWREGGKEGIVNALDWTLGKFVLPTLAELGETIIAWAGMLVGYIGEQLTWTLGALGLPAPGEIITAITTWWDGLVGAVSDILVGTFGIDLPDPSGIVSSIREWWNGIVSSLGSLFVNVETRGFGGGESIGGGYGKGFAVGLDYVPYDEYPATLHRGEAVLTRSEAEDWRAGEGGKGTTIIVNQYITSEAQTAADLMREARWEQERGVLMASV